VIGEAEEGCYGRRNLEIFAKGKNSVSGDELVVYIFNRIYYVVKCHGTTREKINV